VCSSSGSILQVMVKGGITAWASVVSVVALSGTAAALSFSTSPSSPVWSAIPATTAAAVDLRQATRTVLDSRSFTMTGSEFGPPMAGLVSFPGEPPTYGPNALFVVYQAPNRYDLLDKHPDYGVITVGTTSYYRTGDSGAWTAEGNIGPFTMLATTRWLQLLLQGSVQRWGDNYRVTYQSVQEGSGRRRASYGYTATATVKDGRVAYEEVATTLNVFELSNPISIRVDLTYGDFGTSPPVTVPPVD
jgi:hypothetical protein